MEDFGPALLLFAVCGGYIAYQRCYWSRNRSYALQWERILFEAAAAGLALFFLARLLVPLAPGWEWFRWSVRVYKAALPFRFSGSLAVAVLLGIVLAEIINRFNLVGVVVALLPRPTALELASMETAIRLAIEEHGGELFKLLLNAAHDGVPVSLTMENRKVYVGFVVVPPTLSSKYRYTVILPTITGYRSAATLEVTFTTRYWPVYEDLKRRSKEGEQTIDPASFGIVLPIKRIVSANRFDPDAYATYFVTQEASEPSGEPAAAAAAAGPR